MLCAFAQLLVLPRAQGFGGKLGIEIDALGVVTAQDVVTKYSEGDLIRRFGENGSWIWAICHGADNSEVKTVHKTKSMLASKNFPRVKTEPELRSWYGYAPW